MSASPKRGHLIWALLMTAFFVTAVVWPRAMMDRAPSPCMFRYAFGHGCPGCGMTRSVTSLLQGDVRRSIQMHAFGPLLVLIAAGLWIRSVSALLRANPAPVDFGSIGWTIGLAIFLAFYVMYWIYRVATHTTP